MTRTTPPTEASWTPERSAERIMNAVNRRDSDLEVQVRREVDHAVFMARSTVDR